MGELWRTVDDYRNNRIKRKLDRNENYILNWAERSELEYFEYGGRIPFHYLLIRSILGLFLFSIGALLQYAIYKIAFRLEEKVIIRNFNVESSDVGIYLFVFLEIIVIVNIAKIVKKYKIVKRE